jgi:hypothetical protein
MLGGSLVTTAWRVLKLRMEGSPPVTEGSCEYIDSSYEELEQVFDQFRGYRIKILLGDFNAKVGR